MLKMKAWSLGNLVVKLQDSLLILFFITKIIRLKTCTYPAKINNYKDSLLSSDHSCKSPQVKEAVREGRTDAVPIRWAYLYLHYQKGFTCWNLSTNDASKKCCQNECAKEDVCLNV